MDFGLIVKGSYTKNNELSEERINHLESIGFVWNRRDERWMEMYHKLVEYKSQDHGSTLVPLGYTENPSLGIWVSTQRECYRSNEVSKERINHLESIGFVWNPLDAQWMAMYNKLVEYKKQHKSTNVPSKYKTDPKFGSWVHNQRKFYKNNELSEERINHLESTGFAWDSHDAQWMEMYNTLVEYKKDHHGLTTVPLGYTEDPFLGRWASTQRYAYNQGNLLEKRLTLLNAINFDWSSAQR